MFVQLWPWFVLHERLTYISLRVRPFAYCLDPHGKEF